MVDIQVRQSEQEKVFSEIEKDLFDRNLHTKNERERFDDLKKSLIVT
jgi:hypothetical protein